MLFAFNFKMGIPLVVRTSFILSGMLGLKIGVTDSNGIPKVVETSVPFNITNSNQTTMVEMLNGLSENQSISSTIDSNSDTRRSRKLDVEEEKYDFAKNGDCGPGRCKDNEECVTWIKEKTTSSSNRTNRESPMMFHECLPKDGEYHSKLNPSGVKLCDIDQIHSFITEPQPCLKSNPPCPLVWKYKCINSSEKTENSHTCERSKCPGKSYCVVVIDCGLDPPCFPKALCILGGRPIGRP